MSSLSTSNEIPYTTEYLKGRTTSELREFVQRQPGKWSNRFPCDATTSWKTLKSQLLKGSNGFTRAASPSPSNASFNPGRNLSRDPSPSPVLSESDNRQEVQFMNEQIKIYVERETAPTITAKLSVRVRINSEGGGCSLPALRVSSSCSIGHVKLLCHDPEDNDPTVWTVFASFASDIVQDAIYSDDVEFLPVSSDHKRLAIHVEVDMRSSLKHQRDSHSDADTEDEQSMNVDDPNFVPLHEVKKRRKLWKANESSDDEWLKNEISRLDGHAEFVENRGRRKLDNDSIRAHWSFIVSTAEGLVNRKLPKTNKKINVEMVYEALGISRGTFYTAKTACKMLTDHGEDPKIVKQLQKAEGSTELGIFLVQFEKNLKKAKGTSLHKA
uniref:Uncharacterized protein n=1 Tax=Mycena chlorophos TaxID=658473 RepID=A0ABQ0KX83_MYCCL|nr:predicted protein [Mycena chlorophos]